MNCGPRQRFVVKAPGGKPFLVHNCVQATARDLLVENMEHIEENGYPLILTCYDEAVGEVPDTDDYSATKLTQLLATVPHWAPGLPLAAGGFETYRYEKQ